MIAFINELIYRLSEPSQSLLGSFEESVLNGRIEPVSTVEGFTAEVDVGSSHNFKLPVTVFFYTFCDNDRVSSPYSVSPFFIVKKLLFSFYLSSSALLRYQHRRNLIFKIFPL